MAEEFLRRVVEQTRALRVGDPAQGEVDVGPMTMERQRRIVEEHVADAVAARRARAHRRRDARRVPAGSTRPPS